MAKFSKSLRKIMDGKTNDEIKSLFEHSEENYNKYDDMDKTIDDFVHTLFDDYNEKWAFKMTPSGMVNAGIREHLYNPLDKLNTALYQIFSTKEDADKMINDYVSWEEGIVEAIDDKSRLFEMKTLLTNEGIEKILTDYNEILEKEAEFKRTHPISFDKMPNEVNCTVYYPNGDMIAYCNSPYVFNWIRLEIIHKKVEGVYFITDTGDKGYIELTGRIKMDNFNNTPFIVGTQLIAQIIKEGMKNRG